jgi:micrococcal nuclease
MKMTALILVSLLALLSCANNSQVLENSNPSTGKVISIIDGDTYDILLAGNKKVRIRMEGIDAPEKGMPFYKIAKRYLGELCLDKNIRLEITGKDNHGRTLAFSYLPDGTELSHEMIRAGWAWHFKKYSSDSVLSRLEIEARISRIGLWVDDHPMPPWDNRKYHREGISTKDSFKIKESHY